MSLAADAEQIYRRFVAYPLPAEMWVCEQCGHHFPDDTVASPDTAATRRRARHVRRRRRPAIFPPAADGPDGCDTGASVRLPSALLLNHPAGLGYFSDCPSALDLIDWCGLPIADHLDMLRSVDSLPAALHLADLVDAVFAGSRPFESVSRTTVVEWLRAATTGERLEQAFFAADSPEEALRLSAAHELWTVCCR